MNYLNVFVIICLIRSAQACKRVVVMVLRAKSQVRAESRLVASLKLTCVAAAVAMLATSVPVTVDAADLSLVLVETPSGSARYIYVENDLSEGDWWRFTKLLRQNPEVTGVLLRSNGGAADDGLAIAKHIFEHGLSTMVTAACHSVCAVMFLAGRERFITRWANLTVHSAYKQLGNWVVEDHIANGTVAWFIGHMGYPLPLAQLWVSTPSDKVAPITFEMNEKLKLGFTIIEGVPTTIAEE